MLAWLPIIRGCLAGTFLVKYSCSKWKARGLAIIIRARVYSEGKAPAQKVSEVHELRHAWVLIT